MQFQRKSQLTLDKRKDFVHKAKSGSTCFDCGKPGHWSGDKECESPGKANGKFKGKGKSKNTFWPKTSGHKRAANVANTQLCTDAELEVCSIEHHDQECVSSSTNHGAINLKFSNSSCIRVGSREVHVADSDSEDETHEYTAHVGEYAPQEFKISRCTDGDSFSEHSSMEEHGDQKTSEELEISDLFKEDVSDHDASWEISGQQEEVAAPSITAAPPVRRTASCPSAAPAGERKASAPVATPKKKPAPAVVIDARGRRDTVFNFGRYKDKTFGEVITEEPHYYFWGREQKNPSLNLRIFLEWVETEYIVPKGPTLLSELILIPRTADHETLQASPDAVGTVSKNKSKEMSRGERVLICERLKIDPLQSASVSR